jgi:hypothetical protein
VSFPAKSNFCRILPGCWLDCLSFRLRAEKACAVPAWLRAAFRKLAAPCHPPIIQEFLRAGSIQAQILPVA